MSQHLYIYMSIHEGRIHLFTEETIEDMIFSDVDSAITSINKTREVFGEEFVNHEELVNRMLCLKDSDLTPPPVSEPSDTGAMLDDSARLEQADMLDKSFLVSAEYPGNTPCRDAQFVNDMFALEDKYPRMFGYLLH